MMQQKIFTYVSPLLVLIFIFGSSSAAAADSNDPRSLSSAVTTDSAGRGGHIASSAVMRIVCRARNNSGTGFLHRSGHILTAEHVVNGCQESEIFVVNSSGQVHQLSALAVDKALDLALLTTKAKVSGQPLLLSSKSKFSIGSQVTTWGYPTGYKGASPILAVGYLAGVDDIDDPRGGKVRRWVVNAAFNRGNSGGPLIDVEEGKVVGVVVSKLAPIPDEIVASLDALAKQKAGFTYNRTHPDGRQEQLTEGQLVGEILQYLRSQTQLVVGYAVMLRDLVNFLARSKIAP